MLYWGGWTSFSSRCIILSQFVEETLFSIVHCLFVIIDRNDREFPIAILYSVTLIYVLNIMSASCYPGHGRYTSCPKSAAINLPTLLILRWSWKVKVSFIWFLPSMNINWRELQFVFYIFTWVWNRFIEFISPLHYPLQRTSLSLERGSEKGVFGSWKTHDSKSNHGFKPAFCWDCFPACFHL